METDIYNNSGPLALARKAANDVTGFMPGIFGVPFESAPETERGEQRINQTAALTRTILTALQSGGVRNALADRLLTEQAFPHLEHLGLAGTNPDTEQKNVQQFQGYLRQLYGLYQQQALSPGLDPKQAAELQTNLSGLRRLISIWETPAGAAAVAAPAAAGQKRQPVQQTPVPPPAQRQVGQVYPTPRGNMRWMGNGWQAVQ